jgi:hypothetical protein
VRGRVGTCWVGAFGTERVERREVLFEAGMGSMDRLCEMPRMRDALSTWRASLGASAVSGAETVM